MREVIDHYRRHGYAVARGVFSIKEISAIAAAFDRHWAIGMAHPKSFRHGNLLYRQGLDDKEGRILRLVQWPSRVDPVLDEMRRAPALLPLLEPLLGRDIKQIINQLHWKPPGTRAEFAYHQDVRFRRPREAFRNLFESYVQTGIAIDRHRRGNGAMRLLPNSHLAGERELAGAGPVLDQAMADASLERAGFDPKELVDLELEPGDVALWNVYTIHGSGPNETGGERRFYLNGYVRGPDCDRGEWTWEGGKARPLGAPTLVHYEALFTDPEPHYLDP